jgi:Ferritin-like domain
VTSAKDWQLQISEAELSAMTRDLDEAHQESIPAMYAQARDFSAQLAETGAAPAGIRERRFGRRGFLLGLGGVGAGLALAACSSSSSANTSSTGSPSAMGSPSMGSSASPYTGDLKVVALATALENQAVAAYSAALSAATAGKLGTVPPAVATFVQTAMSQHSDHAKAWNAVLSSAKVPTITGVPLSTQPQVLSALGAVTTVGGVANLALELENQAAQTYLFAAGNVTSAGGIATAASIAPVEAMHAAILQFVLGEYPVPDTFLGTSKAASPTILTV